MVRIRLAVIMCIVCLTYGCALTAKEIDKMDDPFKNRCELTNPPATTGDWTRSSVMTSTKEPISLGIESISSEN
jgi:hypothetical protein